ncbi:hypothetical protein GGI24_004649, partial [Coemansia furcata]
KYWDVRMTASTRATELPMPAAASLLPTSTGRSRGTSSLTLDPDGTRLYSACNDNRVYVHNALLPGVPIAQLDAPEFECSSFNIATSVSPCGHHLAAGSANGSVVVWELDMYGQNSSKRRAVLQGHIKEAGCVAWYPGVEKTQLATCGDDGTMRVWDINAELADTSRADPMKRHLALKILKALEYLETLSPTTPLATRQDATDLANAVFMEVIELPSEKLLHPYSPECMYSQPMSSIHFGREPTRSSVDTQPSSFSDEAHAMYCKAQKAGALSNIRYMTSRDPRLMVSEDVIKHFGKIFSPPPAECLEHGLHINRNAASFSPILGDLFLGDGIRDIINGMPSSKSGGGHDMVHMRLLKCLVETHLPDLPPLTLH